MVAGGRRGTRWTARDDEAAFFQMVDEMLGDAFRHHRLSLSHGLFAIEAQGVGIAVLAPADPPDF